MRRFPVAAVVLFAVSLPSVAHAQITSVGDDTSTPIPGAGHDYIHMLSETVNPANGSVSLRIQVPAPKGRGISLPFSFAYDSGGVNHLVAFTPGSTIWQNNTSYLSQGGWSYSVPLLNIHAWTVPVAPEGQGNAGSCSFSSNYVFQDTEGGRHDLAIGSASYEQGTLNTLCGSPVINGGDPQVTATLITTATAGDSAPPTVVTDADGTSYYFPETLRWPVGNGNSSLPTFIEDRNGNQIVASDSGNGVFTFTDTAGRPVISSNGFGAAGATNSITIGGLTYKVTWTTATAHYSVTSKPINPPPSGIQCNPIAAVSSTQPVISSITLPNNQTYTFSYSNNPYGLIGQIKYPDGGTVTYNWKLSDTLSELADFDGQTCYDDPNGHAVCSAAANACEYQYNTPVVGTRTVDFTSGSSQALTQSFTYSTTWIGDGTQWLPKNTTVVTTDDVRAKSFTTKYTYGFVGAAREPYEGSLIASQIPVEDTIQYYDWGGTTLLRTVNKTWYNQFEMNTEMTTLDNGYTSEVAYVYGPGAQVTDKKEYGFGSGAPGSLLRETATTYQTFPSLNIYTVGSQFPLFTAGYDIYDRPSSVVVKDGSGNRVAETDYSYDQKSVMSASFPMGTHDETNYSTSSSGSRANATTVTKQCFPSCTNAVTTYTYDETGQILTSIDPCGNSTCSDVTGSNHTTTYSYSDYYAPCGGAAPPSGNTDAYLTKITDPLGHSKSFCYGYADGQLRGSTDQNGQTTTYAYNDSLGRLTSASYPDGGQTAYTYNDSLPSATGTTLATPNPSVTRVVVMDGVGHVTQNQTTSISPIIATATIYDGLGKPYQVYNPTSCSPITTNCGESTWGYTSTTYDALGRTTQVTEQDGSVILTQYSGNTTTVTDEAGHKRTTVTDGLGRLTSVTEDPSGLDYVTNYTYDTLDDLLSVLQAGSRSRTFQYDSFGRLMNTTVPEINTTTRYTYDANSNLVTKVAAEPNQSGSSQYIASMTYDALNRILTKSYTGGSPTAALSYTYDVPSVDSLSGLTYPVGRLIKDSAVSTAGTTSFYHDYDKMGRAADVWECVPSNCPSTWHSSYQYDLAGNVYSYSDGIFASYTRTFDSAARMTKITSTWPSGTATTLATVNDFFPPGQIQEMTYGNGLADSNVYNSRLQPCRINFNSSAAVLTGCSVAIPSGNLLDFNYGYNAGASDNGNVMSWVATGRQTFSHSYTYDALNRISSMTGSGGSCTALNWTYDAWGNRLSQTAPPGGGTCLQPQYTYLSNNRISPYGYDAPGNLTSQNGATYTYDNENRLVATSSSGGNATYVYDASGRRVQKTVGSSTTNYVYDKDGQVTAWLGAGGRELGYAYMNGQILAQYENSTTYFHHYDHLGSTRLVSEPNQTIEQCNGYYPFGEADNNQCTPTAYNNFTDTLFTGKERDTESNLDNFEARFMASSLGRFMTPDWSAKPQNVPYGVLNNPQSLNLYSFVLNNPVTNRDPDGHWCIFGLGSTCPKPPPPPQPSMGQLFTAIHNVNTVVNAVQPAVNAVQHVADVTTGSATVQVGNEQVDNHGKTSTVMGEPAIAVTATVTVNGVRGDQQLIAQPTVSASKYISFGSDYVMEPNGDSHFQGGSASVGISTPTFTPISAAFPNDLSSVGNQQTYQFNGDMNFMEDFAPVITPDPQQ